MHGKRKSSYFATRITPDLRAALEREAKHSGHSLSQEIERRLRDSVKFETKRIWGAEQNHGLALVINRIAQTSEAYTGERWIANDYTFRLLRAAVERLFSELELAKPGRSTDLPEKVDQMIKSSEEWAEKRGLKFQILTAEGTGWHFADILWAQVTAAIMPDDLSSSTTDEFRALAKMRSLLGIKAVKN
jgi:hypothetical protein